MSIDAVLSGAATHHVACERAESFIDRLPDGCVSLMTLDFPYFRVKGPEVAWDNAWPTAAAFIEWMGGVLAKCRRVLAPNGSIYVFAAPQVREGLTMATRVECEVARHFQIVNRITWQKSAGWHEKAEQEAQRGFFPACEVIIFAEQHGSNVPAMIEAARVATGLSRQDVSERVVGSRSGACWNWETGLRLPDVEHWDALRRILPTLPAYASVVRPFNVSPEVPYTDVWTYETVNTYSGKHPCEKPFSMAEHMIAASSRPGDVVADFFCGSGTFLAAAVHGGRRAIGCDTDPHWAEQAQRRCDAVKATGRIVRTAPKPKDDRQIDLFGRRT